MADVFISYVREDSSIASLLAHEFEARGVSVYFDQDVLVAGTDFRQEIAWAMSTAKVVVVLLSVRSKRSSWVQEELSSIIERTYGPKIISVLLDSHAKENWIWPLVSDRQAFDLIDKPERISEVAERVSEFIFKPQSIPLPKSPTPTRKSFLLIGTVLFLLVIFLLVFFVSLDSETRNNIPSNDLQEARFFLEKLLFPLLTGVAGLIGGYFISRWLNR